ncbi:Gfo/Idh/MocA family protein [Dellaglioa sp. BT-FLS60]
MIKLGIIGTNWITGQFVDAAHESKEFKLISVYSRSEAKAKEFGKKYGASNFYDNMTEFFASDTFEAVYIASPNSLHFEQIKLAIEAGKKVIAEKPMVSNPTEMSEIQAVLEAHPESQLFEAARQIHQANFKIIEQKVADMATIQGATLTYMKYSSRYDAILAGEEPNIFSPKFSGGALQDLGVYVVYDAVSWFGTPLEVQYKPTLLPTGVDGKGVAILTYKDFSVTLNIGKTANSYLTSEIYGLKETIVMDNAAELNEVTYRDGSDKEEMLSQFPAKNPMLAEVIDFAQVINQPNDEINQANYKKWQELSVTVNKVLFDLRQSAGIKFPADDK